MSSVPPSVLRNAGDRLDDASSIALVLALLAQVPAGGRLELDRVRPRRWRSAPRSAPRRTRSSPLSCSATSAANSASARICSTTASVIVVDVERRAGAAATGAGAATALDGGSLVVDAAAVVVVAGEDVVEDGLDLRVEDARRVRSSGSSSRTSLDQHARRLARLAPCGASRGRACRGCARAACLATRLHLSRSSSVSTGSGLVRRSKTASSSSLRSSRDGPLLLLGELARERDQPAQILVDVEAAGVVLGDQLLDPLDEVVRVGLRRGRASTLRRRASAASRSVSARLRPANRAASASKSIWLRSISGSGVDALGGGADHVLLGADRAVEQRVDRVATSRDVGRLAASRSSDALGEHADHGDRRAAARRRPGRAARP